MAHYAGTVFVIKAEQNRSAPASNAGAKMK